MNCCKGRKIGENIFIILIAFGIMLRFFVMAFGHNYDFESYQIVGRIVSEGGNVYAQTERYNYAFLFSLIQGAGFFLCSHLIEKVLTYRIYIVSVLTLADLGISIFLRQKFSEKTALFFFLNPVSIIITGFHNQFDNIAVFFALISILFYDEEDSIKHKDFISILFLTLSLLIKHILYLFFIWILFSSSFHNWRKKLLYVCTPPALFLLSFIPFAMTGEESLKGIIDHVFMYRSNNNFPLLAPLLEMLGIPKQFYFMICIFFMSVLGFLFQKREYDQLLFLYLPSLVAFSSAVANQYLAIPMAMLASCKRKSCYWGYSLLFLLYSVFNANEFDASWIFENHFPEWQDVFHAIGKEGGIMVFIMTVILVLSVVFYDRIRDRTN